MGTASTSRPTRERRGGTSVSRRLTRSPACGFTRNPDLVYVAALGHVWGPNAERGIFRSKDAGASWEKVLFVSDRTGASDLVMDPTNPRILYAGFWQVHRKPWALVSGARRRDLPFGRRWGLLEEAHRRIARGNRGEGRNRRFAGSARAGLGAHRVEGQGGVYRSDDGGEKWTRVNSENKLRQRAWYYTRLYADTKNPETVFALNTGFYRSTDGGRTFNSIRVPHGDNHDLWIDPDEPQRMINSNDGGANVSFNGGGPGLRS